MKIMYCPQCGGKVRSESIGWKCESCKGFIDMQGEFHPHKEEPFMPSMTNSDLIQTSSADCYEFESCEFNGQPKCHLPDGMECPHGVKADKPAAESWTDIEALIEKLNQYSQSLIAYKMGGEFADVCMDAATALSALQGENEKLRIELEQIKQLYESEKEDFIDYACSGVLNISPYCMNHHPDCVDERGWCITEKCHGFSRNHSQ